MASPGLATLASLSADPVDSLEKCRPHVWHGIDSLESTWGYTIPLVIWHPVANTALCLVQI